LTGIGGIGVSDKTMFVPQLQYFDTTLNENIASDGTNWRDATGAIA